MYHSGLTKRTLKHSGRAGLGSWKFSPLPAWHVAGLSFESQSPMTSALTNRVPISVCAGHVHITDFNIATVIKGAEKASSMAGTKPYMGECVNHSMPGASASHPASSSTPTHPTLSLPCQAALRLRVSAIRSSAAHCGFTRSPGVVPGFPWGWPLCLASSRGPIFF